MFISNCSVEKNTATTRFYHGLTARFNIYFNGYESYKAGLEKIESGYIDDFSEILRVFMDSDPATVSMCSSDMERAVQKASKLISLKSITAKPDINPKKDLTEAERALLDKKEFNEWVDDSYFLIALARFHRHEFTEAASVFTYCTTEANDPLIKSESWVWLARVNIEKGNYTEANRILNELELTSSSPKSLKALYYTTLADLFVRQKKYKEAIDPLSRSLDFVRGKRTRYRLTYLLAQLNEQAGDPGKAIQLYRAVVRMNPPYEVDFNARINIAGVFDVNSGNPEEIKNELAKMLKDAKNKDFHDQIYYALANLMKKEGKDNEALEYYRKSASSSTVNQNQKGRSYLALAEYFLGRSDYIRAAEYYDSTVYFLDQNYPSYKELDARSRDLNTLAGHLIIIRREDSLQKVAAMSETERNTFISGLIASAIKEETEGRSSEYAERASIGQYYENERRFRDNIAQEGKWYFYNQTALTFGRTEFRRRWGERRLEDNWRRSNRTKLSAPGSIQDHEEDDTAVTDTSAATLDYKTPAFYLRNLPLNDSLLAISNEKIANAYYNAGMVFWEKIGDIPKAGESFEMLINRFPRNELVPETLYDLYRLYKENNPPKSEVARQRLLERYPESEFSKIISDPDYFNKKMTELKESEKIYNEAYNLYLSEQFDDASVLCDSLLKSLPDNHLAPKFMLLKAYCAARTKDERTFREELRNVTRLWPETEEGKRAAELTASLDKQIPELKAEEDIVMAKEIYTVDTSSAYSFFLVIDNPSLNINQASFDVISYNIDNYTNQNFKTESSLVDNKFVRIIVSGFSDNYSAWDYYHAFRPENIIRNISGSGFMTFLITAENQKRLDEDKNPGRYHLFFQENYLKAGKE